MSEIVDTQPGDQQKRDWQLDIDGRYWRGAAYAKAAEAEWIASGFRYHDDLDHEQQVRFIQRVYRRRLGADAEWADAEREEVGYDDPF